RCNDGCTPVEVGSIPQPDGAAVKTEVAVSSKAGTRKALPVEPVAGERATPVEDGALAHPESAVKTEVKIAFPSKKRLLGGTYIAAGARQTAEVARFYPSKVMDTAADAF
ncbi:unnamed protein product, partial [Pylaiella littoralis]